MMIPFFIETMCYTGMSVQTDIKMSIVVILGDEIMDGFYFLLFQSLSPLNYLQKIHYL